MFSTFTNAFRKEARQLKGGGLRGATLVAFLVFVAIKALGYSFVAAAFFFDFPSKWVVAAISLGATIIAVASLEFTLLRRLRGKRGEIHHGYSI